MSNYKPTSAEVKLARIVDALPPAHARRGMTLKTLMKATLMPKSTCDLHLQKAKEMGLVTSVRVRSVRGMFRYEWRQG